MSSKSDGARALLVAALKRNPLRAGGAGVAAVIVILAIANFAVQPDTVRIEDDAAAESPSASPSPPVSDGSLPEEDVDESPAPAPVLDLPDVVPVPADQRVPKPAHVRGLYLNAWAVGSSRKLARLIDVANRTEINSFVIDVKEGGEVSYRSSVPLVAELGADRAYVRDIRGVLAKLKENGIYPIARIVVFKDKVAAAARPDWAVVKEDGSLWIDHYGDSWVDSFNREVWDYNIAIAREAVELGFSEVQWDYVRFPDVPQSYMRTAVWPAQSGRTKEDGIREFLRYSREQLADLGVPVTADVFGLTVSARDDMGIGQRWEKMIDATDVLLPMVYPSHFARGSYGIAYPNGAPFRVIQTSLGHAVRRSEGVANAAAIRPWLQDFTLGQPRYGPEHVRAQIDAVYEAGLQEWVLWNPGSNYNVDALASADGLVPALPALVEWSPPTTPTPEGDRRTTAPEPKQAPRPDTAQDVRTIWGMPVIPDSLKADTLRR